MRKPTTTNDVAADVEVLLRIPAAYGLSALEETPLAQSIFPYLDWAARNAVSVERVRPLLDLVIEAERAGLSAAEVLPAIRKIAELKAAGGSYHVLVPIDNGAVGPVQARILRAERYARLGGRAMRTEF